MRQTIWQDKWIGLYNPEHEHTNIFYASVKGIKGEQVVDHGPKNIHRILYEESLRYITKKINAVDVGCRDGEFTRYLQWSFNHVYCFDYRARKQFPMNIDLTKNKVSHYTYALGDSITREYASGRGNFRSRTVDPRWPKKKTKIYTLDYFNLVDINLIKIDVDGMDEEVIKGAVNTIEKYKPIIIIEELESDNGTPNHNGVELIKTFGYKVAYLHKSPGLIHKDYIMVPKNIII